MTVAIDEGPRTTVRADRVHGQHGLYRVRAARGDSRSRSVRAILATEVVRRARPAGDRYRNRGYAEVVVRDQTVFADNGTQADVTYTIVEGPQIIVEQIIVTGNEQDEAGDDPQRAGDCERASRSGRRRWPTARRNWRGWASSAAIRIETVDHPGEARRDVLIQLEEADRTTLGWRRRRRRHAPRAADGARRLGRGSPRAGAARVLRDRPSESLRHESISEPVHARQSALHRHRPDRRAGRSASRRESNLGFNEFRVIGTFREPRLFSSRSELLITGIVEQAHPDDVQLQPAHRAGGSGHAAAARVQRSPAATRSSRRSCSTRCSSQMRRRSSTSCFRKCGCRSSPARSSATTATTCSTRRAGRSSSSTRTSRRGRSGPRSDSSGPIARDSCYRQLPMKRRTVRRARRAARRGPRVRAGQGRSGGQRPARERAVLRGRRHDRARLLARSPGQRGHAQRIRLSRSAATASSILNGELRMKVAGDLQGVGFLDAGNVFPLASRSEPDRSAAGRRLRHPLQDPVRADPAGPRLQSRSEAVRGAPRSAARCFTFRLDRHSDETPIQLPTPTA